MKKALLKSALIINIIFWLVIGVSVAFFYGSSTGIPEIFKVLIFFEPLTFLIILIILRLKNRFFHICSIIFAALNTFLSIADELGVMDLTAALLSLSVFILLFLNFPKKQNLDS